MITQDIFTLISIFCDVDDFCKQFEPEWNKILIEDLNTDKKKRSRGVIESVNNKLKSDCQIEHHRHRSPWNFIVNLVSGIVAYSYDSCKPSIRLTRWEKKFLSEQIILAGV